MVLLVPENDQGQSPTTRLDPVLSITFEERGPSADEHHLRSPPFGGFLIPTSFLPKAGSFFIHPVTFSEFGKELRPMIQVDDLPAGIIEGC